MAPYPECHCLSAEERENHGDATGSPPRLRVCRLYLRSRISVRVPERARHRTHSRRDGGVALGREAPAARSEQTVRGLGSVTVWTGDSDRVASSPLTVRGGLRWQSRGEEDGVLQDTGSGGRKQQEAAGSQPLWVPQPAGDGQTQQRSRLRDSVRLPSSWPGPDVGAPRAGDGRTCFRQWGWGAAPRGEGGRGPRASRGPCSPRGRNRNPEVWPPPRKVLGSEHRPAPVLGRWVRSLCGEAETTGERPPPSPRAEGVPSGPGGRQGAPAVPGCLPDRRAPRCSETAAPAGSSPWGPLRPAGAAALGGRESGRRRVACASERCESGPKPCPLAHPSLPWARGRGRSPGRLHTGSPGSGADAPGTRPSLVTAATAGRTRRSTHRRLREEPEAACGEAECRRPGPCGAGGLENSSAMARFQLLVGTVLRCSSRVGAVGP